MADLHGVDPKLSVLAGHGFQLAGCLDSTLERSQLVAVDVVDLGQTLFVAHRALSLRGDAMVLGSSQEVGVGIAEVSGARGAPKQRNQTGSPL